MTRRFPLRPAAPGAAGDWRQTIVMPPPVPAGSGTQPGGGGGVLELFIAACFSPAPGSDGQLVVLSLYGLASGQSVIWRKRSGSDWNFLENGRDECTDAVALVAFFGGEMVVEVEVDGASIGTIDIAEALDSRSCAGWETA